MAPAEQFGRNLRMARKAKQVTQAELASRVYLDRATISKVETGSRYPRLDQILEFADALDVRVRDLLYGIV
jgi:transcriptional regulator with XRE-family HTH domain